MADEEKSTKKKNLVYVLSRASRCHNCDKKLERGDVVKLENVAKEETEALCQKCAGLDAYVLVPKGRAKVTRLATKYSKLSYVVMRWDETWKSYERVGVLAEPKAFNQAVEEDRNG